MVIVYYKGLENRLFILLCNGKFKVSYFLNLEQMAGQMVTDLQGMTETDRQDRQGCKNDHSVTHHSTSIQTQ